MNALIDLANLRHRHKFSPESGETFCYYRSNDIRDLKRTLNSSRLRSKALSHGTKIPKGIRVQSVQITAPQPDPLLGCVKIGESFYFSARSGGALSRPPPSPTRSQPFFPSQVLYLIHPPHFRPCRVLAVTRRDTERIRLYFERSGLKNKADQSRGAASYVIPWSILTNPEYWSLRWDVSRRESLRLATVV